MREEIIIDGENAILGRLASYAAKKALEGHKIVIVNSEKVIISGKLNKIKEDYQQKRRRHGDSQRGPIFPRSPEKILKRTIRGMLPIKKGGKEVLKQIRCYNGIPEEYKEKKKIKSGRKQEGRYVKLEEISKLI